MHSGKVSSIVKEKFRFFGIKESLKNHPKQVYSRRNLKSRNSLSKKVEKIWFLLTCNNSFFSANDKWTNCNIDRRKIKSFNNYDESQNYDEGRRDEGFGR